MPSLSKTTIKKLSKVPKVVKRPFVEQTKKFPVEHYSYSSLCLFATNPLLFKIRYINKDIISSTRNISGIIGTAFHQAMEVYWGGNPNMVPKDESEAIEMGLKVGMEFLSNHPEGWIQWSEAVQNKQKAFDTFSFLYNSYIKEKPRNPNEQVIGCEVEIKESVDVIHKGQRVTLPIPLKGFLDKLIRVDGKLKIVDYKTCRAFSDPEKIDGKKIIQAVQSYFLAYAYTGEEPYSMIFEEVKGTQNRDGGKQTREYEVVFKDHDLYFDFYLRLYNDVTRALSGEMVFVPNIETFFDNEVCIVAYIHRLDMSEEQAAMFEKHKVDNLTDLLRKKIQTAGNMSQLMKMVESKFISARNLNYNRMTPENKIATKMMEHGMMIQFDKKVEGPMVDLYQYTPSIGLKMSRLTSYVDDVEQVLGVSGVRVLAPIPNSSMVGFEVPKKDRYFPALPDHDGSFELAIGQTIFGETKRFDIREAPHVLVAGSTGAGKSVFLNSLIEQIIKIPNAELHLFDPKMVELSVYEDLAMEYHSDPLAINDALENLIIEMEMRYQSMRKAKVRSILEMPEMKYKFVFIDEFADLTMNNANIQNNVLLLAQKARAAGIHLIISTQRPSVNIINGVIKANFPTKVAFRTAREVDSRVIIDEPGAEKLTGKGDMLFQYNGLVERLQGFNI